MANDMKVKRVYTTEVENQDWPGFTYTGEIMEIKYGENAMFGDAASTVHAFRVVTGKITPSGGVRDCGDHYIKANYSSYDRIEKGTFEITRDVEDI